MTNKPTFEALLDELLGASFDQDWPAEQKARAAVLAAYDAAAGREGQPVGWIVRDKWGGFWLYGPDDHDGAKSRQRKQSDEHGNVPELLPLFTHPAPKAVEAADSERDCSELVRTYVGLDAAADEDSGDAEEDAYNLGKRDGFHDAVQLFDLATGGDGEFKGSTFPDETVDVPAMIERIVERLASSPARVGEGEKDAEKMEDALEQIRQWAQAYPLTAFPEPDFAKAHELLKAGGMTLDAISASNMRHVITQVQRIVDAASPARGGEGEAALGALAKSHSYATDFGWQVRAFQIKGDSSIETLDAATSREAQ